MLNVLHVITGLNDGGAEAVLYRICTYDKKNRHTVISMMDEGKYGPFLRDAGIDVYCLGMPKRRLTVRGILELRRILRSLRPGVVQTWMYHANLIGGLIARLCGIRTIVWGIHHTNLTRDSSPWTTILVSKISALLSLFLPVFVVCCSQKSLVVHRDEGYCAEKLVYIPNGYDISQFKPNAEQRKNIRTKFEIEEDIPLLGMVARYDPLKDHITFLKALGMLKRSGRVFRCVFVGSGMDFLNQKLMSLIQEEDLGEYTFLLGRRVDVPALMNAFDILILSSSSEAFPNVLAEAMACGTPCVSTDVGDAAIIVGETGWLVPPKDPESLARAIEHALTERNNAEAWSHRAVAARRRIAMNFEIGTVTEMYGECWKRAL